MSDAEVITVAPAASTMPFRGHVASKLRFFYGQRIHLFSTADEAAGVALVVQRCGNSLDPLALWLAYLWIGRASASRRPSARSRRGSGMKVFLTVLTYAIMALTQLALIMALLHKSVLAGKPSFFRRNSDQPQNPL